MRRYSFGLGEGASKWRSDCKVPFHHTCKGQTFWCGVQPAVRLKHRYSERCVLPLDYYDPLLEVCFDLVR